MSEEENKMFRFYFILVVAILHFIVCGILLLIHSKKDTPSSQGITFGAMFGFGMSFVYLIELLNN